MLRAAPSQSWFWQRTADVDLRCGACQRARSYALVVGFDWRDLAALRTVRSQYPTLPCEVCGHTVENPCPVVQVRPQDPLQILVALPDAVPPRTDFLSATLADLVDGDVLAGPLSTVPAATADALFELYTGFELCGLSDGAETEPRGPADWLAQLREETAAREIVETLLAFIGANDPEQARAALAANPTVLDDRWAPVRERLMRVVAARADVADRSVLGARTRRLGQWVLLGGEAPDQSQLPAAVRAAVDRAIAIDSRDETGERHSRLLDAVELLRSHDDDDPLLLIGALNSAVAALISLPSRTTADLALAADLSTELLARATAHLGGDHRLVRRGRNDRAVALLATAPEQRGGPELIDELRDLVAQCIASNDRLVVDAILNLAVALGERTSTPTADARQEVVELLRLAERIRGLVHPDDHGREVMLLNNLGATLRRVASAAEGEHRHDAIDAYRRAQATDDAHRVLAPSARFQLDVNRLSTEVDATVATLTPRDLQRLRASIEDLRERAVGQFAAGHEVLLETTATMAALAVDLYDASRSGGFAEPTLLDRACEWLAQADRAAGSRRDLRLRMKNTLAVANGRPLPDGQLRDAQAARAGFEAILDATDDLRDAGLRRATARNLAQLHLGRGRWEQAATTYGVGVDAAAAMIARASSLRGRLAEIEASSDVALLHALCLLHCGHVTQAIGAIEAVRRRLAGPEDPDIDLAPVLGGDCVVAWLFTCTLGSAVVAVRHDEPGVVAIDALSSRRLGPPLDALLQARSHDVLNAALDVVTELVAPLLTPVHELVAATRPRELLLVAAGSLNRVPLHALRPNGLRPLADCCVVRFLPSVATAARLRTRPARDGMTVVITNPQAGLSGGQIEAEIVARSVPDAVMPPSGDSVRGFLLDALPAARHVHIACHTRVTGDVWDSEFLLGDARTLTLADLLDLSLPHLESVVAAACRTAVSVGGAPDELLGLGYGLIAAGAAEVICSLWDIDDSVAALLVARVYATSGRQPLAAALSDAQRWCAALTVGELRRLIQAPPEWLPARLAGEFRARLAHPRYADAATLPFSEPSYWAGLIYVGR